MVWPINKRYCIQSDPTTLFFSQWYCTTLRFSYVVQSHTNRNRNVSCRAQQCTTRCPMKQEWGQSYQISLVHTSYHRKTACSYLIPRENTSYRLKTACSYLIPREKIHYRACYFWGKSCSYRSYHRKTPCSYLIPLENNLHLL